jgi:hypothetical protein
MAHQHFLVMIGNVTPVQRTTLATLVAADACTWFNYTTDAWLVCTTSTGSQLLQKLSNVFAGKGPYYVVTKVEAHAAIGGMLPPEAWTWLHSHNLVGSP